ncbi:MAG: hypothetical protein H7834_03540 [Magnetococcus sp. YQC-9]
MAQLGSPTLAEHQKIHRELLQKVHEYKEWLLEEGVNRVEIDVPALKQ